MADLPNIEKSRVVLEGPTGVDHVITSNGDSAIDLLRVGGGVITLGQKTMANSLPIVIPSDQTVPTQDVSSLYAEQDKLYGLCAEINLAGTGEVDALLFKHPTGTGKVIYITRLIACLISTVTAQLKIRVYKSPTITTNGTAVTVSPARIGGSPPATIVTPFSLPTISARGTLLRVYGTSDVGTIMDDIDSRIILEPNTNLLITGQSSSTNKPLGITLAWVER